MGALTPNGTGVKTVILWELEPLGPWQAGSSIPCKRQGSTIQKSGVLALLTCELQTPSATQCKTHSAQYDFFSGLLINLGVVLALGLCVEWSSS